MKIKLLLPIIILSVIFSSCDKSSKTKRVTTEERENLKKEIQQREDFVSAEAISLPDTSDQWFENISVTDKRFLNSVKKAVKEFYVRNEYKSRWLYDKKRTKLYESFLSTLEHSTEYGLNPESYNYTKLEKMVRNLYKNDHSNKDIADLDKEITASFMLFAQHLLNGRVTDPAEGDKVWIMNENKSDEVELLAKVSDVDDLERTLEIFHPNSEIYNNMRDRLSELLHTDEERFNQFEIKDLNKFKPGYESENVVLLRENLEKRGYSLKNDSTKNIVDEDLLETIKEFQKDKTIQVDGLPGQSTLFYLNMTNKDLQDLLVLNMERLRWLNKDFGEEYLIVNIPEYRLFAIEKGEEKLTMKVIVGKEYNATPIFMDQLEYIEFRPTWTVPQSIIRGEMIPRLAGDPNHYTRKGFFIYENGKKINPNTVNWGDKSVYKRHFTFVQQPSTSNALGLVKFIFPNNLSIYLHDTPSDYLFEREKRALSHGCVRVEKPAELATYLLKDQEGWDLDKVNEAMNSGPKQQRVHFDKKIMVQLLYITAYIRDGKLKVFNDVYGFDKKQLEVLKENYDI